MCGCGKWRGAARCECLVEVVAVERRQAGARHAHPPTRPRPSLRCVRASVVTCAVARPWLALPRRHGMTASAVCRAPADGAGGARAGPPQARGTGARGCGAQRGWPAVGQCCRMARAWVHSSARTLAAAQPAPNAGRQVHGQDVRRHRAWPARWARGASVAMQPATPRLVSAQPHAAAATARHSVRCQVAPRPTLTCGLRRRAGGAAQQRTPLRWPRRQGGHRRAASGPGHTPRRDRFGTTWQRFLCTCLCVCCARVARCGCERQGGGRRACVRARVVCLWLEVACAAGKSGQATRGSASLDVRDRAKNPKKKRNVWRDLRSLE